MANVAHSTLTGSNLHENKGVSTATDNTVATAVSGATVWAKLTHSNLTTTGNPFGAQLFHARNQQTSGTDGIATTGAAWNTVVLNTSVTNEITSASLSSNQITLPSGTYFIDGVCPFFIANGAYAKLRLRNITAGSTALVGNQTLTPNASGGATGAGTGHPTIQGRFPLSGSSVLELQIYTSNNGTAGRAASSGEVEVYGEVLIWKLA